MAEASAHELISEAKAGWEEAQPQKKLVDLFNGTVTLSCANVQHEGWTRGGREGEINKRERERNKKRQEKKRKMGGRKEGQMERQRERETKSQTTREQETERERERHARAHTHTDTHTHLRTHTHTHIHIHIHTHTHTHARALAHTHTCTHTGNWEVTVQVPLACYSRPGHKASCAHSDKSVHPLGASQAKLRFLALPGSNIWPRFPLGTELRNVRLSRGGQFARWVHTRFPLGTHTPTHPRTHARTHARTRARINSNRQAETDIHREVEEKNGGSGEREGREKRMETDG